MNDNLSPQQRLETGLLELEGDITLKKREYDRLSQDFDRLQELRDRAVNENTAEITSLKTQRDKLARELKGMFVVFSDIKAQKVGLEEGLALFAREEQSAVSAVARGVLNDISVLKEKNRQKTKWINSQETTLNKLSLSLSGLKKELRVKERELLSGKKTLRTEMRVVLKKENIIIKQAKETKESLLEARRGRVVAQDRLSRANSILKQAEERGSRVNRTLNMKDKALKRHSKVLLGEKRGLDIREKRMKKKEIWLKDKEETLQRSYEEVKAKAKEVGIVI